MQNKQESPIVEQLKNLYYLPSEVAWLENDINQLKSTMIQRGLKHRP